MMIYSKVSGQSIGVPVVLESVTIIWRRDEILNIIIFSGGNTSIFDSDVIKLAKTQDERIQQQKEKSSK